MKVAVISTPVFRVGPPNGTSGYSGLEVIAWWIAKGLADKGHEVTLIAPDGSTCPGATVVQVGPCGWNEEAAYGGFPEMKRKEGDKEIVVRGTHPGYWQDLLNQDVIIDHSWLKCAYLLKAEGRLKAPILGVCHAPVNTMYKELPPVAKPSMVCISEDQATHFRNLYDADVRVAYNGIDLDFYKPMEGVKRTNRFLFLARFSTIKGPDLAIEACVKAGVDLDMVGDTTITNEPGFYERCRAMAKQANLQSGREQIRIIGPCTRGETVHWFSRAHAMIHPNMRFREPFGLAPIEAMACGCPVIAWDKGAMRETIGTEGSGLLVRSMDELVAGIKDYKGLDGRDRDSCRRLAGDFSIQRMVDRYEELCLEAIKTGGW